MTKKRQRRVVGFRMLDGFPVVDATRDITIDVGNDDIAKSSRKDPAACAAAKAMMRADKTITAARVHASVIYLKHQGKNEWTRYRTPTGLHLETVSFDRGGKMQPGTYVATPFPESGRLGARAQRGGDRGGGKNNTVRRAPAHHLTDVRERVRR